MRFALALIAIWVCGCMSAPGHGGRGSVDGGDGGGDGAIDRGVDSGPLRAPFGHLPGGAACGAPNAGAAQPAPSGSAFAEDAGGAMVGREVVVSADAGERVPAPRHAGDLVITELLVDPKTLTDSEGEWFELWNPGATQLDLQGCAVLDRASTPHVIAQHLLVAPGAYVAIARAQAPGFQPAATASFSLINGSGQLALSCSGTEIDRVVFDRGQGFPLVAGASASLDPIHATATNNDDPSAWCLATTSYGPELGTPGQVNPPCGAADAGAS